ncbi:DUF4234 domain-containing protein [Arthrobacter sp. 35W]|uniref:DUF4234 domain-containing protein n=1 Tax=Arthrobacter sp. 35W TaxID=1132441 RepID=UPI0018CBDE83|nr:DUF4234 domain-containing protein [Arthrobacter sp. 35W]
MRSGKKAAKFVKIHHFHQIPLCDKSLTLPATLLLEIHLLGGKLIQRSPAAPLLLPIITFGIYFLVWEVKTKNEMNRAGAAIPSAWWLIVPIANIWWLWQYSVGVEKFTNNGMGRQASFWLLLLLGFIGAAIVQMKFNEAISAKPELISA